MKKLMLTLSLALFVFAGNIYAQTATTTGTSNEEVTVKTKAPGGKKTTMPKGNASKNAANGKFNSTQKERVAQHKDQIKAHSDSKADAKENVMEHNQNTNTTQKDKVKAHKSEIMQKADSKEEAKAKLQRKHDKNKSGE